MPVEYQAAALKELKANADADPKNRESELKHAGFLKPVIGASAGEVNHIHLLIGLCMDASSLTLLAMTGTGL